MSTRPLARAAAVACLIATAPAQSQTLRGVNLAGAAFAPERLPGRINFDYVYPTAEELAYFTASGMNVVRLSILWERLQPTLLAPFDPAELTRLSTFIAAATARHAQVVIDIHNYGQFRTHLIGDPALPQAAFTDLWTRLAGQYGSNQAVLFGLMNEPKQQDATAWFAIAQQAIDAIRATSARNRILVPGIGWDGAHSFVALNAQAAAALHDPLARTIIEVHQYFDQDSSGTHDTCGTPEAALRLLQPMTSWLRAQSRQGFLGEFAVSRRPECQAVLRAVLAFLRQNQDAWLGWTYWAAGPLWGDYMFTIEPSSGQPRPQMLALQPFLQPSTPAPPIQHPPLR